ncbi:Tautomerase enzyme [uncultured archaeon]|nr:Tautomerase enzyme [uncultured archaeon]
MPVVRITLWEGRSPKEKEALIRNVSKAVLDSIKTDPKHLHVFLEEVPKKNWGFAGEPCD